LQAELDLQLLELTPESYSHFLERAIEQSRSESDTMALGACPAEAVVRARDRR
jgi:hypothetical protein